MYKENAIAMEHLLAGETIEIQGFGQSMTPMLKSGQICKIAPVLPDTLLEKGMVVFCKVKGHFFIHKITAVRNGNTYQISNNHGHVNGWVSRNNIYGRLING